jgi:hypothetical protein
MEKVQILSSFNINQEPYLDNPVPPPSRDKTLKSFLLSSDTGTFSRELGTLRKL